MTFDLKIDSFNSWLRDGERGLSSEAIVQRLTGVPLSGRFHNGTNYPHDPADFRRCEMLLRAVPESRPLLGLMGDVSATWKGFVDAWDELVALGQCEAPDIFTRNPSHGGRAPQMFARMQEIREAAHK